MANPVVKEVAGLVRTVSNLTKLAARLQAKLDKIEGKAPVRKARVAKVEKAEKPAKAVKKVVRQPKAAKKVVKSAKAVKPTKVIKSKAKDDGFLL